MTFSLFSSSWNVGRETEPFGSQEALPTGGVDPKRKPWSKGALIGEGE